MIKQILFEKINPKTMRRCVAIKCNNEVKYQLSERKNGGKNDWYSYHVMRYTQDIRLAKSILEGGGLS